VAQARVYGTGGRDCKECERLSTQANYAKGIKVKIKDVYDCENCVVWQSRPSANNVAVVDLYDLLPLSFDYYGNCQVSVQDILALMTFKEVEEDLQEDYYNRMVYFHNEMVKFGVEKAKNRRSKTKDKTRGDATSVGSKGASYRK